MQGFAALGVHILRAGRALGVYVEHEKTVVAVISRDALHGFERVVQSVRSCGGGIDTDTDKGAVASRAENIPVFGVEIRHIDPAAGVVISAVSAAFQSFGEREQLQLIGGDSGDVHTLPPQCLSISRRRL